MKGECYMGRQYEFEVEVPRQIKEVDIKDFIFDESAKYYIKSFTCKEADRTDHYDVRPKELKTSISEDGKVTKSTNVTITHLYDMDNFNEVVDYTVGIIVDITNKIVRIIPVNNPEENYGIMKLFIEVHTIEE